MLVNRTIGALALLLCISSSQLAQLQAMEASTADQTKTQESKDSEQSGSTKELEDNCAICLEALNEDKVKTLHCEHSLHKQCLESLFKSHMMVSDDIVATTCPLCRAPLNANDREDLDLRISTGEVLAYYEQEILQHLSKDKLALFVQICATLLDTDQTRDDIQKIFECSQKEADKYIAEIKNFLTSLTLYSLQSGEYRTDLLNACGNMPIEDLYKILHRAIRLCDITQENINSLMNSLVVSRRSHGDYPGTSFNPHLIAFKRLIAAGEDNNNNNEDDFNLVNNIDPVLIERALACAIRRALPFVMDTLNTHLEGIENADEKILYTIFLGMQTGAFFFLKERAASSIQDLIRSIGQIELNAESLYETAQLLLQVRNIQNLPQIGRQLLVLNPEISMSLRNAVITYADNQEGQARELREMVQHPAERTIKRNKTALAFIAGILFIVMIQQSYQAIF